MTSPLAVPPPGGALAPPARPGLLGGLRCFFRGFGLLFGNPSAWPYAIVPIVVAVALTFGLATLSAFLVPDLVTALAKGSGWWVPVVKVLATVLAVVLSAFVGLALAQPASGPALEALVRKTEEKLGLPTHPPTPFLTDVARSAASAFLGLGGGLVVLTVLLLVGLIPGAAIVTVPLKFLAAVVFVGWDLCDYPLSVRGVGLRRRLGLVLRNADAVLGFALGIAAVSLVPCGFLLVLPAGVVGATSLVARIEAWEASPEAKLLGRGPKA